MKFIYAGSRQSLSFIVFLVGVGLMHSSAVARHAVCGVKWFKTKRKNSVTIGNGVGDKYTPSAKASRKVSQRLVQGNLQAVQLSVAEHPVDQA